MAVAPSHDDGFREIQLSGKQLLFLFMAVTVVLVVTFLTGVLVGRGVKAERAEIAQNDAATDPPVVPDRLPTPATDAAAGDPRSAPPPAPAEEEAPVDGKVSPKVPEPNEEPPVAVNRSAPASAPAAAAAAAPVAKAPLNAPAEKAPAKAPAKAAGPALAPANIPAPANPAPAPPAADATGSTPVAATASAVRTGYAVQVAAVNARGEADAIVKRLTGKGYEAYVEVPKGSTSTFRVRVGTFKTRREAQTMADKLKKEEKFKPWVTR